MEMKNPKKWNQSVLCAGIGLAMAAVGIVAGTVLLNKDALDKESFFDTAVVVLKSSFKVVENVTGLSTFLTIIIVLVIVSASIFWKRVSGCQDD